MGCKNPKTDLLIQMIHNGGKFFGDYFVSVLQTASINALCSLWFQKNLH